MVPGLSGNRDPSPPCFPSVWSLSRKPDHRKNPGASGSLPGGSGKARGRRNRMVYGMESMPLGQTPGWGTCTGAFEKPAPLYQDGKYFLCGRRHLSQYAVCTPHRSRSMGTLALQLRLQRCLSRAGKGISCYFRHFRMNGKTEMSEE